jgi:hypothetical protein
LANFGPGVRGNRRCERGWRREGRCERRWRPEGRRRRTLQMTGARGSRQPDATRRLLPHVSSRKSTSQRSRPNEPVCVCARRRLQYWRWWWAEAASTRMEGSRRPTASSHDHGKPSRMRSPRSSRTRCRRRRRRRPGWLGRRDATCTRDALAELRRGPPTETTASEVTSLGGTLRAGGGGGGAGGDGAVASCMHTCACQACALQLLHVVCDRSSPA